MSTAQHDAQAVLSTEPAAALAPAAGEASASAVALAQESNPSEPASSAALPATTSSTALDPTGVSQATSPETLNETDSKPLSASTVETVQPIKEPSSTGTTVAASNTAATSQSAINEPDSANYADPAIGSTVSGTATATIPVVSTSDTVNAGATDGPASVEADSARGASEPQGADGLSTLPAQPASSEISSTATPSVSQPDTSNASSNARPALASNTSGSKPAAPSSPIERPPSATSTTFKKFASSLSFNKKFLEKCVVRTFRSLSYRIEDLAEPGQMASRLRPKQYQMEQVSRLKRIVLRDLTGDKQHQHTRQVSRLYFKRLWQPYLPHQPVLGC